uniref:IST1-like protein n=1 Tax=Rhizophora mucronata TaxID=61149 RepID=A0A2P2M5E7_RHIMU
MGKKLDAIFGRSFKTSKFKSLANLAISRLAVFRNQRQVRCNQARSDVLQLLEQGHHERALLRVEYVIKEKNMLDVFLMMESYCNLLIERVHLIEQDRECPDELKEAISGLLYASTRCGEFPELQEIRGIFISRYGKEFAASAIELRNNCGVKHKMIQKLSTRQPDVESRMKVLKEIASENNIILQLNEASEETLDIRKKRDKPGLEAPITSIGTKLVDNLPVLPEEMEQDRFCDSVKTRKKYRDVADAAQAAFESAAHAAAAARAAVELSQSDPHDPSNHDNFNNQEKKVFGNYENLELGSESRKQKRRKDSGATELETENVELKKSSSTNSAADELKVTIMSSVEGQDPVEKLEKDAVFDETESETHDLGFNNTPNKLSQALTTEKSNKKTPSSIQAGPKANSKHGYPTADTESSRHFDIKKGLISIWTRCVHGH